MSWQRCLIVAGVREQVKRGLRRSGVSGPAGGMLISALLDSDLFWALSPALHA